MWCLCVYMMYILGERAGKYLVKPQLWDSLLYLQWASLLNQGVVSAGVSEEQET